MSRLVSDRTLRPIPNPYNAGLDAKPAVHILYPQAVPNKAAIDKDVCVHLQHDGCGICQEVCQAKAIDYQQPEQARELRVGAIV